MEGRYEKKRKRGEGLLIALGIFIFLAALGLTLYPVISNYINEKYQSEILTEYTQKVEAMDQDILSDALQAAVEYNAALLPGVNDDSFSREALAAASNCYEDLLNVNGDSIMGYVEIPTLDVYLPIFHGTEAQTLDNGIGHLLGTSLPVGGESTHAVLSGHSGLPGKVMFSDLDQLKVGDVFYLHVLGDTLAYQVDEINTVLPSDTSMLGITRGRDYCTLLTCVPYGINTHRLLVRGTRIPYEEAVEIEVETTAEPTPSTWQQQYIKGILTGLGLLALILVLALLVRGIYKIWRKRHEKN